MKQVIRAAGRRKKIENGARALRRVSGLDGGKACALLRVQASGAGAVETEAQIAIRRHEAEKQ